MDHIQRSSFYCGQDSIGKSQLTATEVEGFPLSIGQRPLHDRRNPVADLLTFPYSLDHTRIPKNTEMVRDVGLSAAQFPHEIGDAFFLNQQGFQDA
jgi:hypothetical protein